VIAKGNQTMRPVRRYFLIGTFSPVFGISGGKLRAW